MDSHNPAETSIAPPSPQEIPASDQDSVRPESGSTSLARIYWEYLNSPPEFDPDRWEARFQELCSAHPCLDEFLWYAFEKDPTGKWRKRLRDADAPVAYLKSVIPHIEKDYRVWSSKSPEKRYKESVERLLASGKAYVEDGRSYKFMAVGGKKPWYHEIDAQGKSLGSIGVFALGLELPLPEDELEDEVLDA